MKFEDVIMDYTPWNSGVQGIVSYGNYELSIVKNANSYGGDKGLFEIGVFKDGEFVELPGITAPGDTVKGFLTVAQVNAIMMKMMTITGESGKNV